MSLLLHSSTRATILLSMLEEDFLFPQYIVCQMQYTKNTRMYQDFAVCKPACFSGLLTHKPSAHQKTHITSTEQLRAQMDDKLLHYELRRMYEQEGQRLRCYVMTKYYVPILYILHATVCILYGQLPYILKVKKRVSDLERSLFLHMATTVSIYNCHWYYY